MGTNSPRYQLWRSQFPQTGGPPGQNILSGPEGAQGVFAYVEVCLSAILRQSSARLIACFSHVAFASLHALHRACLGALRFTSLHELYACTYSCILLKNTPQYVSERYLVDL